jgi:predicted dehydrogenase
MARRLRVGVIGLGRRWQRHYRPALLALSGLFEVAAVCDQVPQRTAQEATRLRCTAAAGPAELIDGDLDAVLLIDPQWFRLWPLGHACRRGKPVFSCGALEEDEEHADALCRLAIESGTPVMMASPPPFTPAARRLAEVAGERLGPVRLVVCEVVRPGRGQTAGGRLLGGQGSGLLAWLASLAAAEPEAVSACGDGGFASVTLRCREGKTVQVTRWRAPGAASAVRVQVVGERGQVTADLPGRLSWHDGGRHALALGRGRPMAEALLERFHQAVATGETPQPGLGEAHRALGWLRAAARSRDEGRQVSL